LLTTTDSFGHITQNCYDLMSRLTRQIQNQVFYNGTTTYCSTPNNPVNGELDPTHADQNIVTDILSYDANGNPTASQTYTYDDLSAQWAAIETYAVYDALNRQTTQIRNYQGPTPYVVPASGPCAANATNYTSNPNATTNLTSCTAYDANGNVQYTID